MVRAVLWSLVLVLPFLAQPGRGQEMTEKYIPVDAYPGMAGKFVVVGVIVEVNAKNKTFNLRGDSDTKTIQVLEKTKIWLDRSLRKEANQDGSFADLKVGLKAEVRVFGPKQLTTAKWVKVQIAVFQ